MRSKSVVVSTKPDWPNGLAVFSKAQKQHRALPLTRQGYIERCIAYLALCGKNNLCPTITGITLSLGFASPKALEHYINHHAELQEVHNAFKVLLSPDIWAD